jgi:pimeloyl-ACP methyl ester carboxylesterase
MPPAFHERPFRIHNTSGDVITGDFRHADGKVPRPLVIVCHGFTAYKDWGPFPYFGQKFAELGFASIVFNFSHNGIGENPRKLTELEKFSRNTIGKELEDLRGVVDAVESGEIGEGIADPCRMVVVGHSRGGGISILFASQDERLKAVAAWSTVATFFRYTARQRQEWERQGFLPVTIRASRTKLRYGIEVLRDLEEHREHYDLRKAARRLSVPLLLVHGKADISARPEESVEIYNESDPGKTELVLIDGAGHMFGIEKPFTRPGPVMEHVIDITANWFHHHVRNH